MFQLKYVPVEVERRRADDHLVVRPTTQHELDFAYPGSGRCRGVEGGVRPAENGAGRRDEDSGGRRDSPLGVEGDRAGQRVGRGQRAAPARGGEPAVEDVAGTAGGTGQGDRGALEAALRAHRAATLGVEGDGVGGVGRPLGVEGDRTGQGVGRGERAAPARRRRTSRRRRSRHGWGRSGKVIVVPWRPLCEPTVLPPSELKVTVSVALAVHWA